MTTAHIIGAGIAGLALAAALPRGWEVHLHEADWDPRAVPTLFGLQAGGLRALARLGLEQEVRRRAVRVAEGRLSDARGRTLAHMQMREVDIPLVPRTELRDLLRGALPASVRVHRHRVHSARGLEADLVVGADGVHSRVRRDFWGPASAARRLPVTVIRGVIDEDPVGGRFQEVWRADGLFGITPRPGGGINWFATVPAQRFSGREEALAHLRRRWEGWAEDPQRVLAHAREADTLVNDLWESRWPGRLVRTMPRAAEAEAVPLAAGDQAAEVRGGADVSGAGLGAPPAGALGAPGPRYAVLIGDAAHAMAPNLGRGANESLVDAAALSRLLETHPLPQALRRYEAARLVRPQAVRRASRAVLGVATTRHDRLRDRLLGLLPNGPGAP
ncbi:FAD-dependent monooxygenase [Brevibacterium album]|uniref:FAD-dependent monooxygenase n=1 Tax=Brevibacterium album TaxID=417948 RepID=UPI00040ECAAF|nr:FAD-dependent monooxygenase [Brevibacterium album]